MNNSIGENTAYTNHFSGSNSKRLEHFIIPTLHEDRPDVVVIHIGSNDVTFNNKNINIEDIAKRIIDIGKKCKEFGVEDVIISSIFIKKNIELSKIIQKINEILQQMCSVNNFHFVNNDNVTRKFLWKDGIHLNKDGTYIFASNIVNYLNNFILDTD